MVYYFTSITVNYFAKARVLCKSLKHHNPEALFFLAVSEEIPQDILVKDEPFDHIFFTKNLPDIDNMEGFFFKHTITELCTAVKPFVASYIMDKFGATKVIYLDPDIVVFHNLNELESYLNDNSIILTPHQLKPEVDDIYIRENEILFLKRGSYNLGFFGVKNDLEGQVFLSWWKSRLLHYCFDDDYTLYDELLRDGLLGMFTDQKWMDLVPSFFDRYFIIRESGYNVCTWNMSNRHIENINGKYYVDSKPLYFFHFSGFDSGAHLNELEKSLSFNPKNTDVRKLSEWYRNQLEINEESKFKKIEFKYTKYSNGELIPLIDRKLYHIRKDVYHLFKNPYNIDDGFYNWVRTVYAKYYVNNKTFAKIKESKIFLFLFPINSRRRSIIKKILRLFKR